MISDLGKSQSNSVTLYLTDVVNYSYVKLISTAQTHRMNITIHINSLESKLMKMKAQIISLTHDLDQALQDINTIKESMDQRICLRAYQLLA